MSATLFRNPRVDPEALYPAALAQIQSLAAHAQAKTEIAAWPGFTPTPLHDLKVLAAEHGLGAIWYKDESGRFGLSSFKALGGAYAVMRQLRRAVAAELGKSVDEVMPADLLAGRYRAIAAKVTVTCATDGNHGRSVAWGASLFGCACVIYVHALVSPGRAAAIAAYGARVVRTAGNYDDSVRQAQRDAESNGWIVISDTSYPGYRDIPRDVMQGYSVMAAEALAQCPAKPTHVFVQGGVGGLAAAVLAYLWESLGPARPRIIVVEPDKADCLYRSARAGRPVVVEGTLDTIMAGLACGEVSLIAWDILSLGADAFMTVEDRAAADLMQRLARPVGDDVAIVAGESAVAGLAGALAARANPEQAAALGLDATSRVLVFGSEGATDSALYEQIVGLKPQDVGRA
ncbi:MAG: diaminopropionate ammonia-lyase [Ferrovibrio sp.]|uniref:diaminopropionate ammonia-lyase n=1 Tax=Ferrovibrio sp. TaxID=1917215 RepID=UPI0026349F85|nr:diaminopropionate ammonia-lyase [Ferrovibrio sp.]MCW0234023.1 diaminopropionate ammonia-lyase [Ferrovibrio sp.]